MVMNWTSVGGGGGVRSGRIWICFKEDHPGDSLPGVL